MTRLELAYQVEKEREELTYHHRNLNLPSIEDGAAITAQGLQGKIATILFGCKDGLLTEQIVECLMDGWNLDPNEADWSGLIGEATWVMSGLDKSWTPSVKIWMASNGWALYPETSYSDVKELGG